MKALTKKHTKSIKAKGDVTKLNALARQIRDGHDATEKLVKSAKDRAREALGEAIITGKALTEAKQIIGFGGFTRWLKEHCKKVSHDTCNRYMSLYNAFGKDSAHVRNLPEMNLRKAYLQLGIINEPVMNEALDNSNDVAGSIASSDNSLPAPIRKQLTNGATSAASSSDNESIEQTTSAKTKAQPIVEAEVVSSPLTSVEHTKQRHEEKLKAVATCANALLIDLFNMIKDGYFTFATLESVTLAPMQEFFAANRKTLTPPAPVRNLFYTPA